MSNIEKFYQRHGIEVQNILHIRHSQGRSHITMINGTVIDTYISIKDLATVLPIKSFLNINKGIVINLRYVASIDKNVYRLCNGECFTGRLRTPGRHTQIRNAFDQHKASSELSLTELVTYCSVLHRLPIPFFLVELVKNDHGMIVDLLFRYCNSAFEQLAKLPADSVRGKRFSELFPPMEQTQLLQFSDVAKNGANQVIELSLRKTSRPLLLHCYCPAKGFVAGVITDVPLNATM